MSTVTNVSVGKPKIGGAIFRAPLGTALPTTADATLNSAFVEMGYVSEDGVTNSNSPESDTVKAWGGDVVLTLMEGREDTFQFTLIEAKNIEVLKAVFGNDNVSGSLSAGISIQNTNEDLEDCSWVIDMILRDNTVKRVVIPDGKVSEVGDVTYSDSDAIGYEITLSAMPDDNGVLHYEYIKATSATTGTTGTT